MVPSSATASSCRPLVDLAASARPGAGGNGWRIGGLTSMLVAMAQTAVPAPDAGDGFGFAGSGLGRGAGDGVQDVALGAVLPVRSFGWWDMFVSPDDDPRSTGGFAGERDTLTGHLRDQRLTLEMKCAGLDAGEMAARSVPPSNLSLLGLVRHLTNAERFWFRRVLAAQDVGE